MSEKNNATIDDAKQTVKYLKNIEMSTKSNTDKIDKFLNHLENKLENAVNEATDKIEKNLNLFKTVLDNQILIEIHGSIGKLLGKISSDN